VNLEQTRILLDGNLLVLCCVSGPSFGIPVVTGDGGT